MGQEPSVVFAPSTLAAFEPEATPRMLVHFFGLFGANGPLPLHLTEYARDRIRRDDDPTFARFLDVFHHRLLLLFYRVWASAQPTAQFDRPSEDRFRLYVGATIGIGQESLRDADELPDLAKLHLSGLFAAHSRSADSLERILAMYFSVPARLEQFVGQWLDLPAEYHCALGRSPETGSLGTTLILGERFWDCQQKFRIVFGPMGYEDYRRLLSPDRRMKMVALIRNYLGVELLWDAQLVLRRREVPPCELGRQVQLGWTTWLTTQTPESDVEDLILNPERLASSA